MPKNSCALADARSTGARGRHQQDRLAESVECRFGATEPQLGACIAARERLAQRLGDAADARAVEQPARMRGRAALHRQAAAALGALVDDTCQHLACAMAAHEVGVIEILREKGRREHLVRVEPASRRRAEGRRNQDVVRAEMLHIFALGGR
ncbi:hypothetical protein [Variovorax paradoxus]|uniref:hypothetical protein n=1 Tax=Variovorax paradoxus TaxID=34073 RepID=UPI0027D88FBB|nr:hypothetical protein [Variovorax paradoxus]